MRKLGQNSLIQLMGTSKLHYNCHTLLTEWHLVTLLILSYSFELRALPVSTEYTLSAYQSLFMHSCSRISLSTAL